jgi:hypothetical protein
MNSSLNGPPVVPGVFLLRDQPWRIPHYP